MCPWHWTKRDPKSHFSKCSSIVKKNVFRGREKNIIYGTYFVNNYCIVISFWLVTTIIMSIIIKYYDMFIGQKINVPFYSTEKAGVHYFFFFIFLFLFFIFSSCFRSSKTRKIIYRCTVHNQKKPLSLKCAINDALIGSQSDKVPTLIIVCTEARISLWGLN